MQLHLEDPTIVMVAPPTEDARRWGVYQFPDMWQVNNGDIYLRVNVGEDTYGSIGYQAPGLYYVSRDGGTSWQETPPEQVDFSPETLRLPNGEEIRFGDLRWVYHQRLFLCDDERYYRLSELGLRPIARWLSPNQYGEMACFRYTDLPESVRRFPVYRRSPGEDGWREDGGWLDFPEMLIAVAARSRLRLTEAAWEDVDAKIRVFSPQGVVALPDGDLVCTAQSQLPGFLDRTFNATYCLASSDRAVTWKVRGTVADQRELSYWGFGIERGLGGGEDSLILTPGGDLLCAMRPDHSAAEGDRETMLSRSSDGGRTWSEPKPVAPSSGTPHLIALDHGPIALVYGRPGVHVVFSEDGGHTWNTTVTLAGPTLPELEAEAERKGIRDPLGKYVLSMRDTCANTDVLKLDGNRFLVAYSDSDHRDDEGRRRKAIKAQSVEVH